MNRCVFEGCNQPGVNNFGVRLRVPGGDAVWAPNTSANVCEHHSGSGMRINVTLELMAGNQIETNVQSVGRVFTRRTEPGALDA